MARLGGKREGAGRKAGVPNRSMAYMRGLAGKHASEAIATLVNIMTDPESPAAVRVKRYARVTPADVSEAQRRAPVSARTQLHELRLGRLDPPTVWPNFVDRTTLIAGPGSIASHRRAFGLFPPFAASADAKRVV